MAPSQDHTPRPRRAAASRASRNITAQYEDSFVMLDSVQPSTQPHDDDEFLPEETQSDEDAGDEDAGFVVESSVHPSTQTPRRSLHHGTIASYKSTTKVVVLTVFAAPVLATPSSRLRPTRSSVPTAPLPTPSSSRTHQTGSSSSTAPLVTPSSSRREQTSSSLPTASIPTPSSSRPQQMSSSLSTTPTLTPSTQDSRKRKYVADIDASISDSGPSVAGLSTYSSANLSPQPPQPPRILGDHSWSGPSPAAGRYETLVREKLQELIVSEPQTAPGLTLTPTQIDVNDGDPFDFVYEKLDLQPGRNYQVEVVTVEFLSPGGEEYKPAVWELCGKQGEDVRAILRLKKVGFNYDEATAICRKFVDALNRWPDIDAISFPRGPCFRPRTPLLVIALFSAAQHSVLPHKPLRFPAPSNRAPEQGHAKLESFIHHIDPETLEAKRHKFTVRHDNINSYIPIPDTPETRSIRFAYRPTLVKPIEELSADGSDRFMIDMSDVPEDQRSGFRAAERFARLCCAMWLRTKSPFKTKSETKTFMTNMVRQFMSEKRLMTLTTIYGKGALWISSRAGVLLRVIDLPPRLRPLVVNGHWPTIRLKSADYSWMKPLSDAGLAVWLETGDLRSTWIALARVADQVNRRIISGETPTSFCDCDISEVNSAHPCGMCGDTIPCVSLTLHSTSGLRACWRCCRKFPSSISAARTLAKIRVITTVRRESEVTVKNIDPAIFVDIRQALLSYVDDLLKDEQGMTYTNQYSARRLQPPPQVMHPDILSVDAVFPFALHHTGQVLVHTVDNVALVPMTLNFLKSTQLPIFLSKVSVYYHQYLDLIQHARVGRQPEIDELKQLQRQLLADCRQLAAIRRQLPHTRKSRMQLRVSPEQLDYLREEWMSGKLRQGSQTARPPFYFIGIAEINSCTSSEWEARRPRINIIVDEIEQWTGVNLLRAPDGCPYFAHPDTMPSDWSWYSCLRLMVCRFVRMRDRCNQYWPTVDSPITIFLECIFQVCVGRMVVTAKDSEEKSNMHYKYAEFLGLPLDIDFNNPLTFTVAHRVHGRQMRTGWPQDPIRLIDRIDADNNILIETRSSNFSKHNFHESYYQNIKNQILNVQIPLKWADESITPRPFNARLEVMNTEGLDDDTIDGEFTYWNLEGELEDIDVNEDASNN